MSARREDRAEERAILNAFSLLTDTQVFAVCSAILNAGSSAANFIINLLPPEKDRVAPLLQKQLGDYTLADPGIAARILAAIAGAPATPPTGADLANVARSVGATPDEATRLKIDWEKSAMGVAEWAIAGRALAELALNIGTRLVPELRFATRIPGVTRLIGTVTGGLIGASSGVSTDVQPVLPPTGK